MVFEWPTVGRFIFNLNLRNMNRNRFGSTQTEPLRILTSKDYFSETISSWAVDLAHVHFITGVLQMLNRSVSVINHIAERLGRDYVFRR